MADDNVLKFDPREHRLIWVCNCGCTTHRAFADGHLECAACEQVSVRAPDGWRERLPDAPAAPEPLNSDTFAVVPMDSVRTFLKRRIAAADIEEARVVVVLYEGGAMATYTERRAELDQTWLREQMDEAVRRLQEPNSG